MNKKAKPTPGLYELDTKGDKPEWKKLAKPVSKPEFFKVLKKVSVKKK